MCIARPVHAIAPRCIVRRSSFASIFRALRPHAFNDSIVESQFLAGFDVSCGEIDAVAILCWINSDVGRVAVIDEAIVIATKNEAATPGINVSVVQHRRAKVSRLHLECPGIEVKVKSRRELPDTRISLDGLCCKNPQPVYGT